MNKSVLFKQAHAMTKQVIKSGDNYNATFALCLKQVIADSKQVKQVKQVKPTIFQVLIYTLLVILDGILDSEKCLRVRYKSTFDYYDNTSFETCAYAQKMLAEYEKQNKTNF